MKRIIVIGMWLILFVSSAFGEILYVTEISEITMRTGKGTDHKIIHMIKSGQEVEVIEAGKDWSMVRLQNGKEGWVLTRWLTAEMPKGILLEKLKADYQQLQAKVKAPLEEIQRLEAENISLKQQLSDAENMLEEVKQSYQKLKGESDSLIRMKTDHQKATKQLAQMTQKAERLDKELSRLERLQIFRWFLSGAGVLLLGMLIGLATRPKRRRSSLL